MVATPQQRAQAEAQREERLRQVAALRLAGIRDQRMIAARMGVGQATISRDFATINARWQKEAAADIAIEKGRDLERIETLIMGLWADASKGKWLAVDRVTNLLARKAAMLGYDSPVKTEHTGADGGPIQIEATDARERLRAKVQELSHRLLAPPAPHEQGEEGAAA